MPTVSVSKETSPSSPWRRPDHQAAKLRSKRPRRVIVSALLIAMFGFLTCRPAHAASQDKDNNGEPSFDLDDPPRTDIQLTPSVGFGAKVVSEKEKWNTDILEQVQ